MLLYHQEIFAYNDSAFAYIYAVTSWLTLRSCDLIEGFETQICLLGCTAV
jgi:hypothetical protein